LKLKEIRKARGWTQQTLSDKSGVGRGMIARIETGATAEPTVSTLIKLANALGVTIDELVDKSA